MPISSAEVSVTDAASIIHTALTDTSGRYTLPNVTQGGFSGTVTKAGYATHTFTGTLTAGQTLVVDAALSLVYPVISQIAVTNVTIDAATVTWTTDQATDSRVNYGTTTAYGQSVADATLTTSHSLTLTGLQSGTTYHFTVTSTNSYGAATTSADQTFTTVSAITLTITSPSEGETIARTDGLVRGSVSNSAGRETGVVVNGVVAVIFGNEFVANHVPLAEGANTVTVRATDAAGETAQASITVNAAVPAQDVSITATELSLAPLETTLTMASTLDLAGAVLSYTGPGSVEFLSVTPGTARVRMTVEGTYLFTVTVRDVANTPYQDTVAVTAASGVTVENLLKGKWDAIQAALLSGDVDTALTHFSGRRQERYRRLFTDVQSSLPGIFASIQTFHLLSVNSVQAEAEAVVPRAGTAYSYPIIYMRDEHGLWTLWGF